MAEIYTVCVSNVATDATINMSVPASYSTRVYDSQGCTVREQTKIVTFTSDVGSDDPYRIFYTYTLEYRTNFDSEGAPELQQAFVTMPAGSLSVTKQVYHYIRWDCPYDSGYSPEGAPAPYASEV